MYAPREFVVGFAFETAARLSLAYAAPLFEEKGDSVFAALIPQCQDPFLLHGPCSRSALSADDHPVDSLQIQLADVFQKRFDREEANGGVRFLKVCDSRDTVFLIFDADTPPDVRLLSRESQFGIEQRAKAFRSFREDLIGMPVRYGHDRCHSDYVIVGNEIVEEVAHGIDEYHFGCAPA